jgi:glutaminase
VNEAIYEQVSELNVCSAQHLEGEIMYQAIIKEIPEQVRPLFNQGKVADYIPALGQVSPMKFAMAAKAVSGETYYAGDVDEKFSLQSISKAFAMILAIRMLGDDLWQKVGRSLSARAFNSISQIEEYGGRPRNPFTNGGAIAIVDLLLTHDVHYLESLLILVRKLTGNREIDYDRSVAKSEKEFGHRNAAIAYFLKSYGILKNQVEDVLDAYFVQCSLAMSCNDLSRSLLFLANRGVDPKNETVVLTPQQNRHLNALLMMFGTYDGAGDFVFRIGLPGKSGVGGGIAVIVPGKMVIAVWSPALDEFGTSVAGLKALEIFIEKGDLGIF